jgi:hypothetical protein
VSIVPGGSAPGETNDARLIPELHIFTQS